MTDDIVTRLRGCWCGDGFANRGLVDPACDHDGVRADAADEIERLQEQIRTNYETFSKVAQQHIADRDTWLHLARRLYDLIPETSSEALYRASVLRDYEELAHKELEKALSHE